MKTAEIPRAANRALLNSFFNGAPLWTPEEALENRILFTANDKSGSTLLHTARAQYENAHLKNGQMFKITVDCPGPKQGDYSNFITTRINKVLMNSAPYFYTQDEVFGGVVLHGIGAKMWGDPDSWRPFNVSVQDILIPTDTTLTMDNLQYFAVLRKMRPGELFKQTYFKGRNASPGWNRVAVKKILDEYKELNTNPHNYDWSNNPEQMTELYKQNLSYYDGDSAPSILFRDFYYREEDSDNPGWYRKMMLDSDCTEGSSNDDEKTRFVFESKRPLQDDLSKIIHFQFGDGNNVPPFMYHSVRSLAFLTYELLWTLNRIRCQWTQHVFEQMMILFRVTDPSDRSRLQSLVMEAPWGIIPEGLNMVTAQERYSVDAGLIGGLQAQYKQLIGEASSSYTQEPDSGTPKERTKFEVQAILAQASSLMGSLLSRSYRQETFADIEIARRFTRKNSHDFAVKKFQSACAAEGIPEKYYTDINRWTIEIDQKLGGGNRMLEVAEAGELMTNIEKFDPGVQQEIKHSWVSAITNNPKQANRLAPLDATPKVSDAKHDAELVFGTLMQGIPVSPKEGVNHPEQIETILSLMQLVIGQIQKSGGVGTPDKIMGLHLAAIYIGEQIKMFAQDPTEKPRVKAYGDALGKLMNFVKAFEQRQQQAAAKQNGNGAGGFDPEAKGKVASMMLTAKAKADIDKAKADQKMKHGDAKFTADQQRKNAGVAAQIQRENALALSETYHGRLRDGGAIGESE